MLSRSSSHRLTGVALAPGRAGSLPVAIPAATDGGLTWVSSGLFRVRTQLALDDPVRERGQVQRGIEVPVQPGAAGLADELPLGEGELGSHRTTRRAGSAGGIPPVNHVHARTGLRGLVGDLAAG